MRINYKPVLIWAGVYALTILAFSFVYFVIWRLSPDSFVVNEQINLGPVRGLEALLADESAPQLSMDLAQLEGLREAYAGATRKLLKASEDLETQVQEAEALLHKASDQHNKVMMANYEKSVNAAIADLVPKRTLLANEIALYDELLNAAQEGPKTYLSLAQSKLRVELAHLDYEIATKKLHAMQTGLANLGQFADKELSNSVTEANNRAIELNRRQIELHARRAHLRTKIREEAYKLVQARAERLEWQDFLYFSVITATTVGYGDIVPNSDAVRRAVMLEIVICIVAFGLLISLLTPRLGSSAASDQQARPNT